MQQIQEVMSGEDPLEKEMTTHSSILTWEIPWTEESGGLQTMGSQKSWTQLSTYKTALIQDGIIVRFLN